MKVRVGLNGFGRIGRAMLRISEMSNNYNFEIVAINARADVDTLMHLFKYDSSYGMFEGDVSNNGKDRIIINNREIAVLNFSEPGLIPWSDYDVDVVIESTGKFKDRENASK